MPATSGVLGVVALLSIDVTRALVAAGYGLGYDIDAAAATSLGVGRFTATTSPTTGLPYPPLAITGATNATPVVITTAHPHGASTRGVGGLSCVISGVLGNTAANNIDTDPLSRTCGLPAGVLAVPLSATTLALYGQDMTASSPTYGALIPIAGSGAYTGGGTLTPALTDGSILVGRENTREHSAPPRIVVVPRTIRSQGRIASLASGTRNADRQRMIRQRSIGTDAEAFDVHAWGQAFPPDPAVDFEIARALRHAVRTSLHLLGCGSLETGDGVWDDQKERETQHIKAGHLLTFAITLRVPVLDNPIGGDPLLGDPANRGNPFVPSPTTIEATVQSPTPEVGAVIDVDISPG